MAKEYIRKKLHDNASHKKALELQRFFKTGSGEYGEGDVFIGVTVPVIRKITKEHYKTVKISEVKTFIRSEIHEERLLGLLFLVYKFRESDREQIYQVYLKNRQYVNNWDLVDLTADKIIGEYLCDKDKKILYDLSASESMWDRRIAVIATFNFIKKGKYSHTLRISKKLIKDKEDLIHKAVGWMLREIGKRDLDTEEGFLRKNYRDMPRTMLRYAIEKFPEKKRKEYLHGKIGQ